MVANHLNQGMHLCQGMHLQLGHSMGKSRCPPRSYNHCLGKGHKTDAIDVGEDHNPQDEIALHGIQTNVTTVATAHATGNTKGAPTHDELFIDAINYGTIGNTYPKEIMVDVCNPWCNEAYTTVQLHASASRKGTTSLHIRLTPELELMCCPSMYFDVSIQTRLAQLACPLAWIMSPPNSMPIMDPIYPYMMYSMAPLLGSQAALVFDPTR